jgi:hypothetical protein
VRWLVSAAFGGGGEVGGKKRRSWEAFVGFLFRAIVPPLFPQFAPVKSPLREAMKSVSQQLF